VKGVKIPGDLQAVTSGSSVLSWAIRFNRHEIVELLLSPDKRKSHFEGGSISQSLLKKLDSNQASLVRSRPDGSHALHLYVGIDKSDVSMLDIVQRATAPLWDSGIGEEERRTMQVQLLKQVVASPSSSAEKLDLLLRRFGQSVVWSEVEPPSSSATTFAHPYYPVSGNSGNANVISSSSNLYGDLLRMAVQRPDPSMLQSLLRAFSATNSTIGGQRGGQSRIAALLPPLLQKAFDLRAPTHMRIILDHSPNAFDTVAAATRVGWGVKGHRLNDIIPTK
jgi:hypothetical protein